MFKVGFHICDILGMNELTCGLVFANSLVASVLSVLHANQLRTRAAAFTNPHAPDPTGTTCFSWGGDLMVIGIIANYAAVAADTFSSELGILSKSDPRLITSLTLRKVPRGTNGGVTIVGLASGLLGSMIIVTVATLFLPMCNESTSAALGGGSPWLMSERRTFMASMVIWGAMGSILDSFLGGLFQRSVKDIRSGKIVQGEGGHRVLVSSSFGGLNLSSKAKSAIFHGEEKSAVGTTESVAVGDQGPNAKYDPKNKHRKPSFGDERPSRIVESGWDLLDNNDVNFLMAVIMSVGAMAGASWYWDVPVQNMLSI